MPEQPRDVLPARPAADRAPATRLTRGGFAAVTATGVALASHLAAGGTMPGPLGVLIPLLLSFSVCAVLAGVSLPWLRLSGSVAVSQVLFHTLFSLGTATAGPTVALHDHSAGAGVVMGEGHLTHGGPGMVLAHVAAGIVTVLALRHGESIVARLSTAVSRVLARWRPSMPSGPRIVRPTRLTITPVRRVVATARLDLSGLSRRGPPVATCSVLR